MCKYISVLRFNRSAMGRKPVVRKARYLYVFRLHAYDDLPTSVQGMVKFQGGLVGIAMFASSHTGRLTPRIQREVASRLILISSIFQSVDSFR